MKRLFQFGLVITLALSLQPVHAQLTRTINESWTFLKDNSIQSIKEFENSDQTLEAVDLPHTWNVEDVTDEKKGFYRGAGWYSKKVRIPSSYEAKQLFLHFEGVNTVAEVYINSKLAGKHIGGYTRFVVPVSHFIEFSEEAFSTFDVVVKADNSFNKNIPTLTADFTFFGGIYRDVNLVVKEKVHFDIEDYAANGVFLSTPEVSKENGEVDMKVRIKNDELATKKVKLTTSIFDPNNELVSKHAKTLKLSAGKSNEFDLELDDVADPMLWSPDSPNLCRVVCEIVDPKSKNVLDLVSSPLGFRWFRFDKDEGFFLNGEHLKLIGTNRHQDYKGIGNALPDYLHVEDVVLMKEMGSNFLRIAHYPQDPAILETCDRLGILTTVETPIVDTVTETEEFGQNCLNAQLEMIRQNYNHPSLIIWAYMNEVLLRPKYRKDPERFKQYTDFVRDLAQELEDLTRAEDPYRYTMIPNHGGLDIYKNAGLTEVPMIVGWNIYDGWYARDFEGLEPKLQQIHEEVDRPMIITEYGAGADPRLHSLNPQRFDFTQEYATIYHKYYLELFDKLPYVAGANVWNYADFSSEHRVDAVQSVNNKGLVGIDRKPKDFFFYYQAKLLEEPFIGIATKTWNRRTALEDKGQKGIATMTVQVFSNQETIELFLNGKSLGSKKVEDAIAVFDVPFVQGVNKLKAKVEELEDYSEVKVDILPNSLAEFPANGLSINIGDERFFYDEKTGQAWGIDRPYTEGSWGSVGGEPYRRTSRRPQHPYGTNQPIKGTYCDPVYQTQLIGLEAYRFDVPPGQYDIKLHFAELEGSNAKHLPYDLADGEESSTEATSRTFSVIINGQPILQKLDILNEYGEYRAVKFKTEVYVGQEGSIVISFDKSIGEPILNAIEIDKKL
ncbi:MAG: DUF4982 domain-containing protein [Cyclobacteriaceae bacterium]